MNDKYNIRIVTKCIDELSDFGFRLDIEIVWTQYNVKQIFFFRWNTFTIRISL